MRKTFSGTYYKHQKDDQTLALIAGAAGDHAFIQIITNAASNYIRYPLSAYIPGKTIRIAGNMFSSNGVSVNIEEQGVSVRGNIIYTGLTPLRYDIMGPFKYLPMECRHKIQSLRHEMRGSLVVNNKTVDFTGGVGYMEGDAGRSFPKSYAWIQCNDFPDPACVMASVADIPFAGFDFRGCIAVVWLNGVEYRMATYLGVRVLACHENGILLRQGDLRLEIEVERGNGHKLIAPEKGAMTREIRERIVCAARFRFQKGSETLLDKRSKGASFEWVRH